MAVADQELLFTFALQGVDAPLHVVRFEGREAISQLFEFDITLVADRADLDLDQALQANATLTLRSRDGTRSAAYRGMLARFEQLGGVDDYHFYRATLVPRLWRSTLNRLNEVYLDEQSIPDVIRSVLERDDLKGPDVKIQLKNPADYRARSFVCQYQESDCAFVSRWMEREGLYYYFDHDSNQSGETLVILDHKEAQPATALSLRYTPPENVQTDRQDTCVTSWVCRKTHLPQSVLVQDFNYRHASLGDDLKAETPIANGGRGHYMLYGQNLRSEDEASRIARVRAEELGTGGTVFLGEAPAIGVRSGYFLDVTHHPRDRYNQRYLVTRVTHHGSQAGVVLAGQNTAYNKGEQGSLYRCEFQALEASVQYRAPRITPHPVISGVLSAIIDSEGSGQYAEINEYGQYKAQLLYDYSAKNANKGTSWLRMATPYAGDHEGMHFPLLKGTEVLLAFYQGDPDQPIILSAVPNSQNPNVVTHQNSRMNLIRTVGGNTLRMIDTEGHQAVVLSSPAGSAIRIMGTFNPGPTSSPDEGGDNNKSDPIALVNATV